MKSQYKKILGREKEQEAGKSFLISRNSLWGSGAWRAESVGDRKRGEGRGHSPPDLISQGKKFKFHSRHREIYAEERHFIFISWKTSLHDAREQAPEQGTYLETGEGDGLQAMEPWPLMMTLMTKGEKYMDL